MFSFDADAGRMTFTAAIAAGLSIQEILRRLYTAFYWLLVLAADGRHANDYRACESYARGFQQTLISQLGDIFEPILQTGSLLLLDIEAVEFVRLFVDCRYLSLPRDLGIHGAISALGSHSGITSWSMSGPHPPVPEICTVLNPEVSSTCTALLPAVSE